MATTSTELRQLKISAMPLKSLVDIDRLLIVVDYYEKKSQAHVALVGSTIARIMRQCTYVTLPYLEKRYRFFSSDTYLVAVPASTAPKNMVPKLIQSRELAKYFVWICINGREEVENILGRFDLDYETNDERLSEAGFLFKGPLDHSTTGLPPTATPVPSFVS
jgi:hypothetical protein